MKIIKILAVGILRLTYFLPALALIILLILLFGHPILGPGLPGSDNANFITLASWLSKWFPRIPFWFPQEGAGVSFTAYYPILNHLIVVIIAKLFSLNILVAFRYYALISVILTSVGIYFLAVRFTKNQTVALLASIFYPLSPIAWTLLLGWGFFAEHASYIFVALAIIFFELCLSHVYENKNVFLTRIFMLLFLIFSALTLLAHPLTFIGLVVLLVPFFVTYPLFTKTRSKNLLFRSILTGVFLVFLTILLAFFFLFPFFRYQKIVSQGAATGEFTYSRPLMLQNSIYFKSFFNLDPTPVIYKSLNDKIQDRSADGWRNIAFPIAISIFALIGLIGSFFLNRKLFALAFANLFPLAIALSPELLFFLFKTPVLNYFGNWRALIIPSRLIIPILAGFGCYTIGYFAFYPFKYLSLKLKQKALRLSFLSLFVTTSSVLTIIIAIIGLYYFKNWPNNPSYLISYGPETYYSFLKPDLRNIWREEIDFCNAYQGWEVKKMPIFCSNQNIQETFWYKKLDKACSEIERQEKTVENDIKDLCSGNINREEIKNILEKCQKPSLSSDLSQICQARVKTPKEQLSEDLMSKLVISDSGKELITGDERKLIEKLPNDPNTRLDLSPGLGSILMSEPFYSNVPELGVYYNQSSLIPLMWNYQISAYHSLANIWWQPEIVDELAKYFGIEYEFLSETNVPIEKFQKNWERVDQNPNTFGVLGLWHFKEPTGLLTATTRPIVLVIGQNRKEVFFRIFHLANIGGLSYDEAILVDGGENIENFSPSQLKQFDAVVMDGYKYKDRNKAWKILEEYIKEGGALYINTGWQYTSQDWQADNLPDFFPMARLDWISVGKTNEFEFGDKKLTEGISNQEISPLIYGDTVWNVSSSDKSQLRDWAKPVLSVQGKPLIAVGSFGKGEVVWTGLDLAGHIGTYKDNPNEVKLYNNLLKYLLADKPNQEIKISFARNYPDKVEFTFGESSSGKTAVYWREAYYPDFKAKLVAAGGSSELKVYKAGPGLTMFVLPNADKGSKIIYEYKTPLSIILARLISLATLATIIIAMLKPKLLHRVMDLFFAKKESLRKKIAGRIAGNRHDEDIDY